MCTVTVQLDRDGALVTMNRDEARNRAPEQPPKLHGRATPWAAPVDGDRGGTWMGVNSAGVVACILNGYQPGDEAVGAAAPDRPSRGFIIPELLALGGVAQIDSWLSDTFDASRYPSFTLILAANDTLRIGRWDGRSRWALDRRPGHDFFMASSAWHTDEVLAHRRAAFDAWLQNGKPMAGHLPQYHVSRPDGAAAMAPLMDRADARTLSITQAEVRGDEAVLRYWRREPDAGVDGAAPATQLRIRKPPVFRAPVTGRR